jgi:hypothetical protein
MGSSFGKNVQSKYQHSRADVDTANKILAVPMINGHINDRGSGGADDGTNLFVQSKSDNSCTTAKIEGFRFALDTAGFKVKRVVIMLLTKSMLPKRFRPNGKPDIMVNGKPLVLASSRVYVATDPQDNIHLFGFLNALYGPQTLRNYNFFF